MTFPSLIRRWGVNAISLAVVMKPWDTSIGELDFFVELETTLPALADIT